MDRMVRMDGERGSSNSNIVNYLERYFTDDEKYQAFSSSSKHSSKNDDREISQKSAAGSYRKQWSVMKKKVLGPTLLQHGGGGGSTSRRDGSRRGGKRDGSRRGGRRDGRRGGRRGGRQQRMSRGDESNFTPGSTTSNNNNVVIVRRNSSLRATGGSGSLRSTMADVGGTNEWQAVVSNHHSRTGCYRVYDAIRSVYQQHQRAEEEREMERERERLVQEEEEHERMMEEEEKEREEREEKEGRASRHRMRPLAHHSQRDGGESVGAAGDRGEEGEVLEEEFASTTELCTMADRLLTGRREDPPPPPSSAASVDVANRAYQRAILQMHHTSTTYAIPQHPLPNANGPPSASLPSSFEYELPLPEYVDRQQCELITRWGRGLLCHVRRTMREIAPHLDVENPSIRQALHVMEAKCAVDRREEERGEEIGRSYPLRVSTPSSLRRKVVSLLENELLPHVGHARHLFEISMRWHQHHCDIVSRQEKERESGTGGDTSSGVSTSSGTSSGQSILSPGRSKSSAEMELSVSLSHVASCLSLEASILFSVHELELWMKEDEERTRRSDKASEEEVVIEEEKMGGGVRKKELFLLVDDDNQEDFVVSISSPSSPPTKTAPMGGRTTTRRRCAAAIRWTQLLSWSCKYHTQASSLRPTWAACLSNSGIALYRLATMGELNALLDTSGGGGGGGAGGAGAGGAGGAGLGGASPLVVPTPRAQHAEKQQNSSSGGSAASGGSGTDDGGERGAVSNEDDENSGEGVEERKELERRRREEERRQIMQADVNSRIRQLLTLALKSLKRAHGMAASVEEGRGKKRSADVESYVAAISFLQAELFLRSYVFMMKATPTILISMEDEEEEEEMTSSSGGESSEESSEASSPSSQLSEESEVNEEVVGGEVNGGSSSSGSGSGSSSSSSVLGRDEESSNDGNRRQNRRPASKSIEDLRRDNPGLCVEIAGPAVMEEVVVEEEEEEEERREHVSWDLVASDNGCRVLDGLMRRYDRIDSGGSGGSGGSGSGGGNGGGLTTYGLIELSRHLVPSTLLGRRSEEDDEYEREMYKAIVARFVNTVEAVVVVVTTEATDAASESIAKRKTESKRKRQKVDNTCFRRILAHRAQLDPVPLWRMLEGSMKMPSSSSSSAVSMYNARSSTVSRRLKRNRSTSRSHFSVSSGLSNHPINELQEQEALLEEEELLLHMAGGMQQDQNGSGGGGGESSGDHHDSEHGGGGGGVNSPSGGSGEGGGEGSGGGLEKEDGGRMTTSSPRLDLRAGSPMKGILQTDGGSDASNPGTPTSSSQRAIRRDSRILSADMLKEYLSEDDHGGMDSELDSNGSGRGRSGSGTSHDLAHEFLNEVLDENEHPDYNVSKEGRGLWKKAKKSLYNAATKLL